MTITATLFSPAEQSEQEPFADVIVTSNTTVGELKKIMDARVRAGLATRKQANDFWRQCLLSVNEQTTHQGLDVSDMEIEDARLIPDEPRRSIN